MRAMVLHEAGRPLVAEEVPEPRPGPRQLLLRVHACGLCRTDLHIVDGELTEPKLPLIPGHQIVGTVVGRGEGATAFEVGARVGVPWLGGSCRTCEFCATGSENLCPEARYTGYRINGGFAERCVADEDFCFPIPERYPNLQAAPLLCAGLIGYRAYRMAGNAGRLGLYGFGSAAHILCQLAVFEERRVFAFVRRGDESGLAFARRLGAEWAGASDELPPQALDAAIIFAPAGELVPAALASVRPGGVVVCAGIHMSTIPAFDYSLLWQERVLRSVANLTRKDGEEFFDIAPRVPIRTQVHPYGLTSVNEALDDLRAGRFDGAAVIEIDRKPRRPAVT